MAIESKVASLLTTDRLVADAVVDAMNVVYPNVVFKVWEHSYCIEVSVSSKYYPDRPVTEVLLKLFQDELAALERHTLSIFAFLRKTNHLI